PYWPATLRRRQAEPGVGEITPVGPAGFSWRGTLFDESLDVEASRTTREEKGQAHEDQIEYQARDLFDKRAVPALDGIVATTPAEARAAAERLMADGSKVVVVKAQVKVGGRGKAGGVKLAKSADEAAERAGEILGMDIKGHTVHRVMIAAGADIAEEYYF